MRITADVTNNSLLIYANAENYRIIESTLRQIDRPQLQIAIDATIAEVTLNDSLNYGVQFFLKSTNLGAPPNRARPSTAIGGAVLGRVLPGFNILIGNEASPQVVIDALHTVTDVKILSNPSLVVTDNGVATLQVGDQVPITTGTATVLSANNAVVNTIDYQNTGIILRVVPRIGANNMVMLDIEQEISNVSNTNPTGLLTPTISQRKVSSTLASPTARPCCSPVSSARRRTWGATAFRCSISCPACSVTRSRTRTSRCSAPSSSSSSGRRSSATP